ncbi:hypothetical protein BKA56DRAFT_622099 [Ilyonectria sp. MPI-CAGE-AT-0026]|nr:hypothetical protein BKA56DRAFT_622099 [Ilyonectria sp. MPI-CAGE-AT-0026]
MGLTISRQLADQFLSACKASTGARIFDTLLEAPLFQYLLREFLRELVVTELPPECDFTIKNYVSFLPFPKYTLDASITAKTTEWIERPSTFFQSLPDNDDLACQLYHGIQRLSQKNCSPLEHINSRGYVYLFNLLRSRFKALFHTTGNADPLPAYLCACGIKDEDLAKNCNRWKKRGKGIETLSKAHPGMFLLVTSLSNREEVASLQLTTMKLRLQDALGEIDTLINKNETYDIAAKSINRHFQHALDQWLEHLRVPVPVLEHHGKRKKSGTPSRVDVSSIFPRSFLRADMQRPERPDLKVPFNIPLRRPPDSDPSRSTLPPGNLSWGDFPVIPHPPDTAPLRSTLPPGHLSRVDFPVTAHSPFGNIGGSFPPMQRICQGQQAQPHTSEPYYQSTTGQSPTQITQLPTVIDGESWVGCGTGEIDMSNLLGTEIRGLGSGPNINDLPIDFML